MSGTITRRRTYHQEMKTTQKQYPVHHIPDDAQPVEVALDPVHCLFLAQVVAQVAEVAIQEDLPLSLHLDHHLPLLPFLLGPHIVQLPVWTDRKYTVASVTTHKLWPRGVRIV